MNGRMDQNGRLTLGHGAPDEDLSRDPLPMRYWDRFRYLLITDGWVAPGKLPQALALGAVVGLYFGPCSVHTTCKRRLKTGCIAQPSCSVSSRPGIRKKKKTPHVLYRAALRLEPASTRANPRVVRSNDPARRCSSPSATIASTLKTRWCRTSTTFRCGTRWGFGFVWSDTL